MAVYIPLLNGAILRLNPLGESFSSYRRTQGVQSNETARTIDMKGVLADLRDGLFVEAEFSCERTI